MAKVLDPCSAVPLEYCRGPGLHGPCEGSSVLTTQTVSTVHSVRSQKLHTKQLFFGGTRGSVAPPAQSSQAVQKQEQRTRPG